MKRPTDPSSGQAREPHPHSVPEAPLPSSFRPLVFGETLFDHFPDGSRALGGAPFNVAWHLRGFKAEPLLVTGIGDDSEGREILALMGEWGMDPRGVQIRPDRPTGKVTVALEGGDARFRIEARQAYDGIEAGELPSPGVLAAEDLLYHGTLAMRESEARNALARLRESVDAPVLVDVNLREPWWTPDAVSWALDGAHWAKMNGHEAATLAGLVASGDEPLAGAALAEGAVAGAAGDEPLADALILDAARKLRARHHLHALIVTLGAGGALGLLPEGAVRHRGTELDGLVDTVGAGDAFSAVVALGIHFTWTMETILRRAAAFAADVCRMRGATSRDPELYAKHRRRWSHDT